MSLPSARSATWSRVFVASALLWTAALLVAGYVNSAQAPPWRVVGTTSGVVAVTSAILTLLGFLGLRATFAGAHLGLLVGYASMLWTFVTSAEGMADLAAVATFMVFGAIGLGVGALVDVVRYFVRRSRE